MFLGDAPFLATRTLGDACGWRRPFLGDAYSWRRICWATPPSSFVFYLFTPWYLHFEWKEDKTEARFFLNFFFFYLGDLVKKPPRGKKSVPYNKIVTWLFTYIIQLKSNFKLAAFQLCGMGPPSKVPRLYESFPLASVILKGPVHLGDNLFSSSYG